MLKIPFILLLVLFSFSVSIGQNLIKNGSFEEGGKYWSNWTPQGMPAGSIFEVSGNYTNYGTNPPPDGKNFVEIDIESNFSQTVNTTEGDVYKLKFAITRRYNANGDRIFRVVINNQEIFRKTVNTSAFGKSFEYQEVEYKATANTAKIGFYTTGNTGSGATYGVMTDDISFTKIEKPVIAKQDFVLVSGIVKEASTGLPLRAKLSYEWNGVGGYIWSDSVTGAYKLIGFPSDEISIKVDKHHYFFSEVREILKGKAEVKIDIALTPIAKGAKLILKNVLFEQSKYFLKDSSKAELDKLTDMMKKNPQMEILLTGHTDNVGDDKKNMELSLSRVKEVKKYLVSQGIQPKRVKCTGKGESQPIADNNNDTTRHLNRRVEIEILKI